MTNTFKPALIGDPNHERFVWLKNVLDEEYGIDAIQAKTFGELVKLVEESNRSRERAEKNIQSGEKAAENDWSMIFIADEVPPADFQKPSPEIVKMYFGSLGLTLNKWLDFNTILIKTRDAEIDWRGTTTPRIIRLSTPPKPEERQSVAQGLEGISSLQRVPSAASKIAWDQISRALREQIRGLSERRNLQDGKEHLARLISRCLDCSNVDRIDIKALGQGKSGASVFRLCVEAKLDGATKVKKQEFVLKLCPAGAVWKLASEVRGHMRANQGLGHPGYRVHIPALNKAYRPSGELVQFGETPQPNLYIVRSGHWYAVHYDFLGGDEFGEFVDLETALIAPVKELQKKIAGTGFAVKLSSAKKSSEVRARIMETILQWLSENWYTNSGTGYVRREEMIVWESGDAPEQEYIAMPPYKLTGKSKGWIQSFLNSQEAEMGARFFNDWEEHRDKVFRLVSEDTPETAQLGKLGEPLPVLLSQVHGDLNANNILLWLKHKHPFLIDFPFYQQAGHALQDFARLEVEIKLALLDRQKDSPEKKLKAFEHTYSQMPIWQEMEDRLLKRWEEKTTDWSSKGYAGNVKLCFELLQLVRLRAREVQQNNQCPGPAPGDFLDEYWPALLYHTVRAIGYPSLSVFKRLLAVYSAGSILTKLNCFINAA